jgi:cell fate (sporulation/competence/biofilm development) regulator YlbF (YheA/YmcA/DUF963 family)
MDPYASIPTALRAATEALGESLSRTEPIDALHRAQARLDTDESAKAILDRVAEAEDNLRRRQAEGTMTKADIDRVRNAQREASSDPSITGFGAAHQAVVAYLPEVNGMISELLGWDFAAMAAAPTSC